MKKISVLMITIAVLAMAGCQNSPFQQTRKQSYDRWYSARAGMLCSVAEDALENGNLDTACSKAREAKSLAPELPQARLLLGRGYIEQGSYAAAVEELTEATRLRKEDPKAWYLLGVAQEKNGQSVRAVESYSKAIELESYYKDAIVAKAQVLVETGNTTLAKKLMDDNFHVYQNDRKCIDLYGRIAMLDGDYARAAEVFRISLEVESKNNETRLMLARSLIQTGRFGQAKDEIVKVLDDSQFKAASWIYSMLGDCYLGTFQIDEAYKAYTRACEMSPQNPGGWVKLAQADLAAGRFQQAQKNADHALMLCEDNLQATLVTAYVMIKTGKPSLALATLYPLSKKYPDNTTILCLMGRCHEVSGEAEQARKYYEQAIQLATENTIAQVFGDENKQ